MKIIFNISKITSPFIKLLSLSTNFVLNVLGMKAEKLEENISKEEIKSMIEAGQANGVFNETEKEMINSIFEFDDITVGEIMTARTDVYMVNIDVPVSEYQANGVFNETEKEMINSIFEFDDITVGEIMTARTDVYMVNIDVPVSEYIDNLLSKKYARVPVYQNTPDNIIGTLHMKDLILEARKNGFENIFFLKNMQEFLFIKIHLII